MTRVLVPLAVSSGLSAPRDPFAGVEHLDGLTMGTSWSLKYVRPRGMTAAAIQAAVQERLDQVVAEMSHWDETSLLCRFNRAVPGEWRDLPPGFFTVLSTAIDAAEASGGAYDPTIGALVDLWGFGPAPARSEPPSPARIEAARAQCGWRRLTLDHRRRAARQPGGVRLDFSAIAKGFGVDRAADGLLRLGLGDFLIEVGGELRGHGAKPDGAPWWVALERPPASPASGWTDTLVALHGLAIATSGDYRRYFESDGRRYAHTIDPRTGWPVANNLVSATVIHRSCMKADVFATVLTVLGMEDGMAFAERHDLAALLVARTGDSFTEAMSPALAAMLD